LTDEQKQDNTILAVAPDSKEDLLNMIERISEEDGVRSDFPFLSDLGLRVIRRYGIFNPDGAGGGRYQVPHPATYVIDKEGVVRWASVDVDYSARPSNEDVLAALAAIQ
jgi:peroxiredoxin